MRFFQMISSKNIWLVMIVSLLMLLGAVFSVLIFGVRNRVNTAVAGDKYEILDKPITASLVNSNNYLNIIMLRMKNPGIENNGFFVFELIDETGYAVRKIDFRGMNIGDPGDMRFQFEPIENSAGKEYRISVTPDDSQPMVSIEVSKDGEISYTSYFRTINKPLAAKSLTNLLKDKIISNLNFFSFWVFILFGIFVYDLKRK